MMLANTPSGDAFTMTDYNHMLDASGFAHRELFDVPMSPQQVIVAER